MWVSGLGPLKLYESNSAATQHLQVDDMVRDEQPRHMLLPFADFRSHLCLDGMSKHDAARDHQFRPRWALSKNDDDENDDGDDDDEGGRRPQQRQQQ